MRSRENPRETGKEEGGGRLREKREGKRENTKPIWGPPWNDVACGSDDLSWSSSEEPVEGRSSCSKVESCLFCFTFFFGVRCPFAAPCFSLIDTFCSSASFSSSCSSCFFPSEESSIGSCFPERRLVKLCRSSSELVSALSSSPSSSSSLMAVASSTSRCWWRVRSRGMREVQLQAVAIRKAISTDLEYLNCLQ